MFRFNSKGEFNIPYGGINYNHKDFSSKITSLRDKKILSFLQNIEFFNLDFNKFLNQFSFSHDDFIFLDPPYDSNFKNYGQHPFGEEKQRELAHLLATVKAKWMLVIQETPLIHKLYSNLQQENPKVHMVSYDKSYTYNVRGRNDRKASHLLIMNYSQ
jgi:DNA adenine methylase